MPLNLCCTGHRVQVMAGSASVKFRQEFEARSGDTIRCVLMAKAYGSAPALSAAGLEAAPGKKDIWGLLIFAEKSLHFFVHASETSMGFLLRSAARAAPPKEQWAAFPKERIRDIAVPKLRKGFLSSLLAKPSVFELSFASNEAAEGSAASPAGAVYTLYFETLEPVKDGSVIEAAAALL